jgi:phage gp29-like protein
MPRKKPSRISAERVRQARQGNTQGVRHLTPETLATALESFDLGYLRTAALLWQKIRDRDDTLKAVSAKRDLDCALLDWEILSVDDSREAKKHKEALEAFYNNLSATHVLDQNQGGGVSTLIGQMQHAVGHKYAVHEIVWDPSGPDLTAEFRFVPLQFFENTTGRLRYLPTDYAALGEDMEDGGWMVTMGAGLMEASSIAYLYKQLPLKSWLIFCDKFGIPGLHGETNAPYGSEEWNQFREAVAAFSQDWALVTSMGGKINPIEVSASGSQPHKDLVDRMDRGITRLWRGADLGTMSQQGDATGSNPQESESDILSAGDAKRISETLQRAVDRWVIKYRFGTTPKAYFNLQPKTKVNHALELQIDESLIRWGVPRGKKDLLEKYGRPEPDPSDELVGQGPAPVPGDADASRDGGDAAVEKDNAKAKAKADNKKPDALVNSASTGRAAIFKAASLQRLSLAQAAALQPLITRLASIEELPDAEQRAALDKFKTELPALYTRVLGDRELATAFEEILGTALVDGYATAATPKS